MSALPPHPRAALLSQSRVGRAVLAEFADFNPADWEPYTTKRRGSVNPAGTEGFRHRVHKTFRRTLPAGYRREGNQVVPDDGSALVAGTPTGFSRYTSHDPHDVYRSINLHARTPNKIRLLAAHLADTPDAHPEVRHAVSVARQWAEHGVPSPVAEESLDRITQHANDIHWGLGSTPIPVRHAVTALHPDDHIDHEMEMMLQYVLAPHRHAMHAVRAAHALRSMFHVGEPVRIPVNRDIRTLALAAHDTNDPLALAALADALEEEGHAPDAALSNLRNPHSAVRGNWVIDAILGRKT